MLVAALFLRKLQIPTYGSSSPDAGSLQEVGNSEFDAEEITTALSLSPISMNERAMPIFSIPQTLATVIPPPLPAISSATTSSAAETTHWHTTFFFTTYPTDTDTGTDTQPTATKSTTTSSKGTASSTTSNPTETPNKNTRTSKAPTAVIIVIVILGIILCSLLVMICWFRKKRKHFYRGRKNNSPRGDRSRARGGFDVPVPMTELRRAEGNKTSTSLVRRNLPHSTSDRNEDTVCPFPQLPNETEDIPAATPFNKQSSLETRSVAPPGRQRPAPLALQNERHKTAETAETYQTELRQSVNNDEIASIIEHYTDIPENGSSQLEDLIDQEIEHISQRYGSPESRETRTDMIERPRSEPLFFKLYGSSENSGWKGLTPRTPLTPSTGLRTQDCDTPLFPQNAPLIRNNDQRQGQNMGNHSEEWDKDSPQYSSDQTTDPEYEAWKREIQRKFGFGEQVFPLRIRKKSQPSDKQPYSSNVHNMHGWGTFANNDPRWEEHTEHASSRRYGEDASRSQFSFTGHEGNYDPNSQEALSHSISSLRPRPLVIRKVNSLPTLESVLTEPKSSESAYVHRASEVPYDPLEYLPATRYDPLEDRTRFDVRSYGSDDTIREIHKTMEMFNSMGQREDYDIEETRSHYDYADLDSHGRINTLDMHHYEADDSGSQTDASSEHLMSYGQHGNTVGPSTGKGLSPSSSRLSQVDLGSVSGSLHMSADRSNSTKTLQLRRRSEETLISDDVFGPNIHAMRAGRDYVLAVRGRMDPPVDTEVPGLSSIAEDSTGILRRNLKGKMPDRGKPSS